MRSYRSKDAARKALFLLVLSVTAASAQQRVTPAEENQRDAEMATIRRDLESLKNENKRLATEIEKNSKEEKQSGKERVFVDLRGGGSLGMENIAGSGYGYATGLELFIADRLSATFRFSNGLISLATPDFNSRLRSENIQVSGTDSVSANYFSFSSGFAYYFFKGGEISLGASAAIVAKKLSGSLFEAPVYPAAAVELFAWYQVFPGVDVGALGRFEYAKISQISISGSNVIFSSSKSANEVAFMAAVRFAVL